MSPMSEISSSISSTSTTAQRRKIKKPLIEKRRRLRINQCLASLKSLVLEATNKDENCFPKMEKADILELTVAYMRTVRHHSSPISVSTPPPPSAAAADSSSEQARTYLSGYRECAMEVCRFFTDDDSALPVGALPVGVPEVRAQLTRHLSGCFQRIQLDLQSIVVDRSMHHGQLQLPTTTTTAGGMERERAGNNKRRCTEEDRLPSPSFSSSSSSHSSSFSSSSSSPIPFSSSVSTSSPSNHAVTDIPRNPVSMSSTTIDSSINPTQFTSIRRVAAQLSSMRDSKPLQSIPASASSAVFSSVLQSSSRSKMVKQTPRHAQHHQHQHHLRQSILLSQQQQPPHQPHQQHQPHHQQQQQDALPFSSPQHCLSPKRGDEFPAAAVVDATKTSCSSRHSPLLTTPTTIAMVNPRPIIQSTCIGSRTTVAFFEPLPTNAEDPSLVWRPW